MDLFTLIFWVSTLIFLLVSLKKDKDKTWQSLKMARGMMGNLIGEIMGVLLLIGLLLTYIPPERMQEFLGNTNSLLATLVAAIVGGITLIPAFVAFPLVASFMEVGVSIVPAVAFLTTLTMVGFVTFPLERTAFGTKFALTRNLLSFLFAVIIAALMGVIV